MQLNRIDNEKNMGQKVERIEIQIGEHRFSFSETPDGKLHIHAHHDEINIHPGCRNTFDVSARDM